MAENQDERSREDLSDEISQHRLQEYRRKGMVFQSKELSGLAVLITATVTTFMMSPHVSQTFADLMTEVFKTDLSARLDLGAPRVIRTYLLKSLVSMATVLIPICGAAFVVGGLASFLQVGSIFSWDPITPDFEKINPISGFKRLFSFRQVIEGLRIVFKMVVVLSLVYLLVKSYILTSPVFLGHDLIAVGAYYGKIFKEISMGLFAALFVFAGFDFGYQRWEYMKNLRLTKQEAKQEHKEQDGDPQIRSRIRAIQREMSRRRMMQAIKKADVIITNPTHIAVAIVYDRNAMSAPKVVAKGADLIAQKMKDIARESGVPMVENVPLARALFKSVKVGQVVPRALYQAVAEVLAYVYRLRKRNM